MNIHFICRGNVLRSLIAETYLKSLNKHNVQVISSGTHVDWTNPQEKEYFANTLQVLKRHGIVQFAKSAPEQLTQDRIDTYHDVIILMNQRVIDEASQLVNLPSNTENWQIVDIGEGHRTQLEDRENYEEDIYQEIIHKVDRLLSQKLPHHS